MSETQQLIFIWIPVIVVVYGAVIVFGEWSFETIARSEGLKPIEEKIFHDSTLTGHFLKAIRKVFSK